jgi:hypothetical protein
MAGRYLSQSELFLWVSDCGPFDSASSVWGSVFVSGSTVPNYYRYVRDTEVPGVSGRILHHIGERFAGITRQLQAAELLSKLSTVNAKTSFVKFP